MFHHGPVTKSMGKVDNIPESDKFILELFRVDI